MLCVRSLDLKCYVQDCLHKLHTLKCKRSYTGPTRPSGCPGQHGGAGGPLQGGGAVKQQQGAGRQPSAGQHQGAGVRTPQGQSDGVGYRRNGRGPKPSHATGWNDHHQRPRHNPVGDNSGGRQGSVMDQDFHMVTAQQLLGAIQEMVKQVLDQGHQLPEQCQGGRPSS